MSENKFKYFAVTTTAIVKANNKTDAEKIALGNRKASNLNGELVYKDVEVERISAVQAREQLNG